MKANEEKLRAEILSIKLPFSDEEIRKAPLFLLLLKTSVADINDGFLIKDVKSLLFDEEAKTLKILEYPKKDEETINKITEHFKTARQLLGVVGMTGQKRVDKNVTKLLFDQTGVTNFIGINAKYSIK